MKGSPFSTTRMVVYKLLGIVYADKLTTGVLSVVVQPFVMGSRALGMGGSAKRGRKNAGSLQLHSKRVATTLYEALVDTVNFTFWLCLGLIVADVMFGNRTVFNYLDQNRWLAFLLFAFLAFRYMVRSEK